jgi:hypothetical protein
MAIFGKNGIVRKQEVAFAKKLLLWKYEKSGITPPGEEALSAHAERVVDEAHEIAKKSGKNMLGIMKDIVRDFTKKT